MGVLSVSRLVYRGPRSVAGRADAQASPPACSFCPGHNPVDGGQPGLRGWGTEPGVDLEGVGLDAGDGPAVAERGDQLVLADPPGAEGSGLAVAEAHQVAGAAGRHRRGQAGDVPGTVVVVEDVEQPAV